MEDFNEAEEIAKIQAKREELAVAKSHENEKSLVDIKLDDIRFKLNTNQSLQAQIDEVTDITTTARALSDESTKKELTLTKSDEIVNKARAKAAESRAKAIDAETEVQKAEQSLYEAVLNTFGIFKHLPNWLMKIVTMVFSPVYLAFCFIIGTPCALFKILIENIDGIVCRYEKVGDTVRPKVRAIFWIILSLGIISGICLTILKCLNKI